MTRPSRGGLLNIPASAPKRDPSPISVALPCWLPPCPTPLSEMIICTCSFPCLLSVPLHRLSSWWRVEYLGWCLAHSRHSIVPKLFHVLNKHLLSPYATPSGILPPMNTAGDKTKSSPAWSARSRRKENGPSAPLIILRSREAQERELQRIPP